MIRAVSLFAAFLAVGVPLRADPPVVANVRASQIPGTKNVEILYDVSDGDGDTQTIAVQVSGDGGQTYTIPATALSGHVGAGVTPGVNRRIVWDAGVDWNGHYVDNAKVRVTAYDGTTPPAPPGMVYVPGGQFQMGDAFAEGSADERPLHNVTLSQFFMEEKEVTCQVWSDVATWARNHGYDTLSFGFNGSGQQAVSSISWYIAVRWCNARSEMEGLEPVYYTNSGLTEVMRNQTAVGYHAYMDRTANGYRLPTEAEWERAARGGLHAARYPRGDSLDLADGNFVDSGDAWEALTPPVAPPGQFVPNGLGLYDMDGNVSEHCFDLYADGFYGSDENNDPIGPTQSSVNINGYYNRAHVYRGGNCYWGIDMARVADRRYQDSANSLLAIGIRCVRNATSSF